jgi:hypothetical protein
VAEDEPIEPHIAVGQYILGSATAISGLLVAGMVERFLGERSEVGGAALLAAPALVGLVVCGGGNVSSDYEGDCMPAIVGAYVGSLSDAVPILLIGLRHLLDHPAQDDDVGTFGASS